jgi:3-hydroxyisobutyrate dehydrogenase
VSGGGQAAREHRLLVMVGGDQSTYESVLPVLSTFGDPVVFLGTLGSGQLAKLVNNLLLTANLSLAHQAVQLGRSLGVDEDALVGLLRHGSGRSFGMEMYTGLRADFESRSQAVRAVAQLLRKDVELADRLVAERSLDAGLLTGAAHQVLAAMGQGQTS